MRKTYSTGIATTTHSKQHTYRIRRTSYDVQESQNKMERSNETEAQQVVYCTAVRRGSSGASVTKNSACPYRIGEVGHWNSKFE